MRNFILMFARACYDPKAYAEFARGWRWKVLPYFIVLSIVSTLGACLMSCKYVNEFYEEQLNPSMPALESAKLKGDRIVTPDAKELKLASKSGKVYGVVSQELIDATRTSDLLLAFEKDRLSMYMPDGREISMPLDSRDIFGLSEISLSKLFPGKYFALFVLLPSAFFALSLFMNVSYLAMLTLAVILMNFGRPAGISFASCARLALFSLTPSVLLEFIFMALFKISMPGFAYALVSGAMIVWSLNFMRRNLDGREGASK